MEYVCMYFRCCLLFRILEACTSLLRVQDGSFCMVSVFVTFKDKNLKVKVKMGSFFTGWKNYIGEKIPNLCRVVISKIKLLGCIKIWDRKLN